MSTNSGTCTTKLNVAVKLKELKKSFKSQETEREKEE